MKTALIAVLSLAVAAAAHPAAGNVVNGLGSPLACKGGKFGELLCRSPREYTRCKGSENYQYVWSEVASGTVCTCTRTKCALVPKTSGYVGEDTRPATSLTYTMVGPRHTHRRHTKWHSKASSGTETNIITFSPTRTALTTTTTTTPTMTLESGTSTVTGTSNIVRYTEVRTTTVVMTTAREKHTHSKHAHMTETDTPAGPYSNTSTPVVTKHQTQTQTQTLTAQPDEMPQQIKAARPQTSRTEVFYMPFNPLPLPFYLEDHKSHPRAMEQQQQQQEQQQQEQHQEK